MIVAIVILMLIHEIGMILAFALGVRMREGKSLNPITIVKETIKNNKDQKTYEDNNRKNEIMLKNIDNYDGTSKGQQSLEG